MTFPSIQHVGESLFALAGLAAVVAGLAARTTLNHLFAGVQIALTQPIRLDDVVIVEGEWGRVEEITTTYVVVRIWDLRRLVVPVSYFIDKPFQNWTRQTADLLGTVFIFADESVACGGASPGTASSPRRIRNLGWKSVRTSGHKC
jgi:small-conductance mechanosensitive channel